MPLFSGVVSTPSLAMPLASIRMRLGRRLRYRSFSAQLDGSLSFLAAEICGSARSAPSTSNRKPSSANIVATSCLLHSHRQKRQCLSLQRKEWPLLSGLLSQSPPDSLFFWFLFPPGCINHWRQIPHRRQRRHPIQERHRHLRPIILRLRPNSSPSQKAPKRGFRTHSKSLPSSRGNNFDSFH